MHEKTREGATGRFARNHRRRLWKKVVSVLACVVVFCTTYALILPALTAEKTSYCGKEEHIHSEACYARIDAKSGTAPASTHESEAASAPTHESETASASTHESETASASTHESKTAPASTHESETALAAELESPAVQKQTDGSNSIGQSGLICGHEEHTHSLECFSDRTADVETANVWEATLPKKLPQKWEEAVVAVAESQIGYIESEKNYMVAEAEVMKGYTRYGEWSGNPYGDWDTAFLSFCLHYAGVTEEAFPREASCGQWITTLQKKEYNLYRTKEAYEPKAGDLVFFDTDGDQTADHAGLVAELLAAKKTETPKMRTIEGDLENSVRHAEYELTDEQILGYGVMPEKEVSGNAEATETETTAASGQAKGDSSQLYADGTKQAGVKENSVNGSEPVNQVAETAGDAQDSTEETGVTIHKTIDAFRDNIDNPDTELDNKAADKTDLYRLYLDAVAPAEKTPVDLLIVVDQSGSMHMDYNPNDKGDYQDMFDEDGTTKIFRDQAVRLVLNGTHKENEYIDKKQNGLISQFLSLNPDNRVAAVSFQGDRMDGFIDFYPEDRNPDGDVLLSWTDEAKYLPVAGQKGHGTNYCGGMLEAKKMLESVKNDGHKKIMLFLSDGYPTFYLRKAKIGSSTIRDGDGMNMTTDEIDASKAYFDELMRKYPDLVTYTIGISKDVTTGTDEYGTRSSVVLEYMAEKGKGSYTGVNSTQELIDTLRHLILDTSSSQLVIEDELSQYVDLYTDQPDFKVTMKKADRSVKTLYENGVVQSDGQGILTSDSVSYDSATKKVSVVFDPTYKMEAGATYTLSFNIKTNKDAYTEYEKNGYSNVVGDANTDYEGNKTSSGNGGFRSNKQAKMRYVDGDKPVEEIYPHPVVQVTVSETVTVHKTIDAFWDDKENPDTDIDNQQIDQKKDLYRLYLDAKFSKEKNPSEDMVSEPINNVVISDTLSDYVELYEKQPDYKVTMKSADKETVLYEGDKVTDAGTNILQEVTYDKTSKKITAVFAETYEVENDCTYTLSFNVKTTEKAYTAYKEAKNTYPEKKGDAETDYGTNATSSGQDGYPSNSSATLTYKVGDKESTVDYPHPVIQVWPDSETPEPSNPPEEPATVTPHKTIDAFRDGADNPDTDLDNNATDKTDLYRLYLDAKFPKMDKPTDLLLVVDNSGSMFKLKAADGQTRNASINSALKGEEGKEGFISKFLKANDKNRIRIVYFSGPENVTFPDPIPANYPEEDASGDAWVKCDWTHDLETATKALLDVCEKAPGKNNIGTNYAAGLNKADEVLGADPNRNVSMVFLSDGMPTYYVQKDGKRGGNGLSAENESGDFKTKGEANEKNCKVPTENAIDTFKENHPNMSIYPIFFSDNETPEAATILEGMAHNLGTFARANSTDELWTALDILLDTSVHNVTISDTLSAYVDLYEDQPDYKVTMEKADGEVIVLYEGGAVTTEGLNKLKAVTYANKTVSAVFEETYKMEEGCTYTLSFNVKTKDATYQAYKDAGNTYPDKGDPETDYGENDTSSNKGGYHSNTRATLTYKIGNKESTVDYPHPVIQVWPDPETPGPSNPQDTATVTPHKTIDAFRDGVDNPDTDLDNDNTIDDKDKFDLYRLYLDAQVEKVSEPVDLLIVIDQSGSMHMNYKLERGGNVEELDDYKIIDESKWDTEPETNPVSNYRDMEDYNNPDPEKNKLFRDEAVRLVLNGTQEPNDYGTMKQDGIASKFLSLHEKNKIAVIGFQGGLGQTDKPYDPQKNKDAEHLLSWMDEKQFNASDAASYIYTAGKKANATNYCAALLEADRMLEAVKDDGNRKVMLFLSDGIPTVYLKNNNQTRAGTGYTACPTESMNYFKNLQDKYEDLTTYTIGIASFTGSTSNSEILKEMANYAATKGGGKYLEGKTSRELKNTLEGIINRTFCTGLVIRDTLSDYVDLYKAQPDYKVTMKKEGEEEIVLYANGAITTAGTDILKEVTFNETSKEVKAVFKEDYKLEMGYTYTLSFNVKTTNDAYQYYAANEYPHEGDLNTDYGNNATSSLKPGFYSNKIATLEYKNGAETITKEYPYPVVQVKERKLIVKKKWFAKDENNTEITNIKSGKIKFRLYRYAIPVETPTQESVPVILKAHYYEYKSFWGWGRWEPIDQEMLRKTVQVGSQVTLTFSMDRAFELRIGSVRIPSSDPRLNKSGNEYTYKFKVEGSTELTVYCTSEQNSSAPSNVKIDVVDPPETVWPLKQEVGRYTISSENSWETVFRNLPEKGTATGNDGIEREVTYKYFVDEVSVDGYDTDYSENNKEGVEPTDLVTLEIKNTSKNPPTHELPETGGPGTDMYTIGGLLLMLAGMLLLYKKTKCGKEDFASS